MSEIQQGTPVTELAADGAKPGAGQTLKNLDFDADSRADQREKATITIGGHTFHRRRKNWELTRTLRRLLRKQERTAIQQKRLNKQLEDLPDDAPEDQFDRIEQEVDDAQDAGDEAAYQIIALLLVDEDKQPPSVDDLKEGLDVEDAGALALALAMGGEVDPTQATATT